jgi:hypothetical protein
MTNATMNRNFDRSRSPLFGVAAVVATAVTLGIAVLLPANLTPAEPLFAAAPVAQPADTQLVTLPAIEVVGVRSEKTAAQRAWVMPAVFKHKS